MSENHLKPPDNVQQTDTARFWRRESGLFVFQVKENAFLNEEVVRTNETIITSIYPECPYVLVDARASHRMTREARQSSPAHPRTTVQRFHTPSH